MAAKILCPVCGSPLRATAPNPDMYTCTRRKVWVSELNLFLNIIDATIYLSPEGKQIQKIIEIPPYIFNIIDTDQLQVTKVKQIRLDKTGRNTNRIFNEETILRIDAVMDMPWKNKKKIVEKLKTYILFS